MASATDVARERGNARIRRLYDKSARRYDRDMGFWERVLFRDGRSWACSQAEGKVVEIAVGTGRNLPYYPEGVRVTGIELSPAMLEIAQRRAQELGREAELRLGDAHALDLPDESFDTVVCTFSLCTIPDDRRAVAEAKRVLRPGGHFLLVEHVRSTRLAVRAVQHLIEPISLRFHCDHMLREPLDHLKAEGLEIEKLERYGLGIVERVRARKPE